MSATSDDDKTAGLQPMPAGEVRVAVEVTSAAFEEAMREHGILPDAIKLITADARAKMSALDDVHAETLAEHPQPAPPEAGT